MAAPVKGVTVGAVGFTSGDPNKVDVAGDTMTGDLVLAGAGTDLTVGGVITDTYAGVSGDVMRLLTTSLSTTVTSGGVVTINADPTKFDITATEGWIVDYDPTAAISATNPMLTPVSYPGATGLTVTLGAGVQLIFLLIDSTGAVVQQATAPTRVQYRTHLVLAAMARTGANIVEVNSLGGVTGQLQTQFMDLTRALGGFSSSPVDNFISANGVNLMVDTTGGSVFFPSFNLYTDHQDPHVTALTPQTPATFNRMSATTILPGTFTNIDVANYDPNGLGVITPVGGGANTSTIFRVYVARGATPANQMFIQYGQTAHASLAAARDAIGTGTFVVNPAFIRQALVGWIVATRTATDLSDPAQALFVHAPKFAAP